MEWAFRSLFAINNVVVIQTLPFSHHLSPLNGDQCCVYRGQHNRLEHHRRTRRETGSRSSESYFWMSVKHALRQVPTQNQGRRREDCPRGKPKSGGKRANRTGEEGFFWKNGIWHCHWYRRKHNYRPTERRRHWSLAKRAYDCRQHSWQMVLYCVFINICF